MSWYRTGDRERLAAVFRATLGEALRAPLARTAWLVLAIFTGLAAGRISGEGTWTLVLAQFAVFFALVCSGETMSREYATRRAVVFLGCGVGRRQHYLATCAAWMTVHLVGCWAFGLLFLAVSSFQGTGGVDRLAGVFAIPLLALPVLCLGFAFSVVLPGWSNIAVLLVVLLVLGLVGDYEESFGFLSSVARAVLGTGSDAQECLVAGSTAETAWRVGRTFGGAALRVVLFLVFGAWLAGTRVGRRRLGAAATATES